MRIRDAVRRGAVTVETATTVATAAQLMDRAGVGTVLVTDGGRLVGIASDRDLVVRGLARRLPLDARIDAVMTTAPTTLDAEADLEEAVEAFAEHAIRRLPVLDGEAIVGVLTADDLVLDLVNDLDRVLRPVAAQVLFGGPQPQTPATA